MSVTLEDLGLSQEELQDRVIESLCEKLLRESWFDEDEGKTSRPSVFREKLDKEIQRRIDAGVNKVASAIDLEARVQNICLAETNRWGEKKPGRTLTFTEYLVERVEAYMSEPVDSSGRAKSEHHYPSEWRQAGPRITVAIQTYIKSHIETAMKQVIANGNKILVGGMEATMKQCLQEIAARLAVEVKV